MRWVLLLEEGLSDAKLLMIPPSLGIVVITLSYQAMDLQPVVAKVFVMGLQQGVFPQSGNGGDENKYQG